MSVYFDNAASTPTDERVLEEMIPYMKGCYGNPSSIHTHGREARVAIEKARKKVATLLNTSPAEIFFTSGGTESDNTAIVSTVRSTGVKCIVTSPLEHHAVLHTIAYLEKKEGVAVHYVKLDRKGHVDYADLELLLSANPFALVCLMHGNNEVGNITDLARVSQLCKEYSARFHSDTVQTVGHHVFDLTKIYLDFMIGSAHKFHGPKGVGFVYINADNRIQPLMLGGSQERNMRAGTENVAGIMGLAKALEIAVTEHEENEVKILGLKQHFIAKAKNAVSDLVFNGDCENVDKSLSSIVNIGLPSRVDSEMLVFNMDIHQISASGGSACTSGTLIESHVLKAIQADEERGHIRFSFSKYNTMDEVDYVVEVLKKM